MDPPTSRDLSQEQAGYRVLLAETGPAGLEQARRERPDLLILDLNLPGMDGMEVAARLRAESDVFILILTALRKPTGWLGCGLVPTII